METSDSVKYTVTLDTTDAKRALEDLFSKTFGPSVSWAPSMPSFSPGPAPAPAPGGGGPATPLPPGTVPGTPGGPPGPPSIVHPGHEPGMPGVTPGGMSVHDMRWRPELAIIYQQAMAATYATPHSAGGMIAGTVGMPFAAAAAVAGPTNPLGLAAMGTLKFIEAMGRAVDALLGVADRLKNYGGEAFQAMSHFEFFMEGFKFRMAENLGPSISKFIEKLENLLIKIEPALSKVLEAGFKIAGGAIDAVHGGIEMGKGIWDITHSWPWELDKKKKGLKMIEKGFRRASGLLTQEELEEEERERFKTVFGGIEGATTLHRAFRHMRFHGGFGEAFIRPQGGWGMQGVPGLGRWRPDTAPWQGMGGGRRNFFGAEGAEGEEGAAGEAGEAGTDGRVLSWLRRPRRWYGGHVIFGPEYDTGRKDEDGNVIYDRRPSWQAYKEGWEYVHPDSRDDLRRISPTSDMMAAIVKLRHKAGKSPWGEIPRVLSATEELVDGARPGDPKAFPKASEVAMQWKMSDHINIHFDDEHNLLQELLLWKADVLNQIRSANDGRWVKMRAARATV